jgi:L-seryl-tRNA(Ser) seleniumtransferase
VRARAERLRELLAGGAGAGAGASDAGIAGERLELVDTVARAGAGALPVTEVPSCAVALAPAAGEDAGGLAVALRTGEPAVVCRVHDGRLLLDLRAVSDAEVVELAAAVRAALA